MLYSGVTEDGIDGYLWLMVLTLEATELSITTPSGRIMMCGW